MSHFCSSSLAELIKLPVACLPAFRVLEKAQPQCNATVTVCLARQGKPRSINRGLAAVQQHLRIPDANHGRRVLQRTQALCRRVSTFEFYNLPEHDSAASISARLSRDECPGKNINATGSLQNVTQDFTRFLGLLGRSPSIDPLLSPVGLESRDLTNILSLRVRDVIDRSF